VVVDGRDPLLDRDLEGRCERFGCLVRGANGRLARWRARSDGNDAATAALDQLHFDGNNLSTAYLEVTGVLAGAGRGV
jgi:hypothetical protein